MQTDIYQQTIVMAKLITDVRKWMMRRGTEVKASWAQNFESWIQRGATEEEEQEKTNKDERCEHEKSSIILEFIKKKMERIRSGVEWSGGDAEGEQKQQQQ